MTESDRWTVDVDVDYNSRVAGYFVCDGSTQVCYLEVGNRFDQKCVDAVRARAVRIAAVPKMLEALLGCGCICDLHPDHPGFIEDGEHEERCKAVRDALLAAGGSDVD